MEVREFPKDLRDMPEVRQIADFLCAVTPDLGLQEALWLIDQMSYSDLKELNEMRLELTPSGM